MWSSKPPKRKILRGCLFRLPPQQQFQPTYSFFLSPLFTRWVDFSNHDRAIALSCIMIVLGYLMVCRLKFPSLKVLPLRIPSFHLAFLAVVVAVFVLYGILYFFAEILALFSWSYVALALVLSFIRLVAGKKSKTLVDFEPEPDDFDNFQE
jgi:CDP-diacylglycerol--serine O-phosphatidyltransferase